MTVTTQLPSLRNSGRFFIGGEWVEPSSSSMIEVIDSGTEEPFFQVAEAQAADMDRAVGAARAAFDHGPWPRLSHAERAEYLRAFGDRLRERADEIAEIWPRESGILAPHARGSVPKSANAWNFYADLATSYAFEDVVKPSAGAFGLLVREPVGVVGAIIPWNSAITMITYKVAPALLAGCTVVLKCSPEAPGEGYVCAEIAREIGLPPGVLNVVTADRAVSELLVTDPRVDKITFTGSTAAGRRIASLCGDRIARCTLELGGKSAAVVLDDADLSAAAKALAMAECILSGQVCSSLTRVVVTRARHDELVDALAAQFASVIVGSPFDPQSQMGPLAASRHRDRVESHIATGIAEGAQLVVGGKRPPHLDRGWFVEPTLFSHVDNRASLAREETFGPVLSVIPAGDEAEAVRIANDTVYGLNASVFTADVDRARAVAGELRAGTVGHNAFRTDFGMAFGGFKQSGIGREGGTEGVLPFLETKSVILDGPPARYRAE
ncbi:aldehyde dehydrogenase [Sporichthya polymorpha]|uniref:aldehyde dehydrogenase n=1 Tax=Sporichthya polymorpha TaxID=35751 RepID=UPI0003A17C77|nr:aldehyde dehydrogenase [Sporichthya polymorpha]